MACCQVKLGKSPCNRCDSGHTCGSVVKFNPSHLSLYNPTALDNGLKETAGSVFKVYKTIWLVHLVSIPIAFGVSYQRNQSIMLGVVQGVFFPWLYLGYRGVQAATGGKKK